MELLIKDTWKLFHFVFNKENYLPTRGGAGKVSTHTDISVSHFKCSTDTGLP